MAVDRTLFQKDCEYRYVPGMQAELNNANKEKDPIKAGFIDNVLATGTVSDTDFFYLRAVAFFRIATAEMVTEFLKYFRSYYGPSECNELLLPKMKTDEIEPLSGASGHRDDVAETRRRLMRLAKRSFLFSHTITREYEERQYVDVVFSIHDKTVSLVRSVFYDTPFFGNGGLHYDRFFYCVFPVQRMMETMHACRVAVLGFNGHKKKALLSREKEIVFGAQKERYTPPVIADIDCGEYSYKVVVAPLHLCSDDRIVTKTQHRQYIEGQLALMGRLINHYKYMERTFQDKPLKERIRFLIATENVDSMQTLVSIMDAEREKYNGKVFFVTDTFLLGTKKLEDCIFMAKEMKDKVSGENHLKLVLPTKASLISSLNEWVIVEE